MSEKKIYHTKEWHRARYKCLQRYPVCEACRRVGRDTKATVADHMLHAKQCPKYFVDIYDINNLVGLCHTCHQRVTIGFDNLKRWEEFIVNGRVDMQRMFVVKYDVNKPLYDDDGFSVEYMDG